MILSIGNLTKSYDNLKILDNINYKLFDPTIVGLVGPNGAGKSTLIKCIANLLTYEHGEIEIFGKSNKNYNSFKDISFLMDNRILYPYLSGYDHLNFIKTVRKLPSDSINDVIKKLDLTEYIYQKVESYSLGMKQNLLRAMAILPKSKLIIMDEPLNGLDPSKILMSRDLIKDLHKSGISIIISSHSLLELDYITDNILFLNNGKIIQENIESFKNTEYTIIFSNISYLQEFEEKLKKSNIDVIYNKSLDTNKMTISVNNEKSAKFMNLFASSNTSIEYFNIRKLGAENRYREIFGV